MTRGRARLVTCAAALVVAQASAAFATHTDAGTFRKQPCDPPSDRPASWTCTWDREGHVSRTVTQEPWPPRRFAPGPDAGLPPFFVVGFLVIIGLNILKWWRRDDGSDDRRGSSRPAYDTSDDDPFT